MITLKIRFGGLNGMRQIREKIHVPLATNIRDMAVDVILLDTTFWDGIRPCLKAAGICETFQLGTSVHSSGELGIQLASMLHLASVLPNLSFAADAHYHELRDDIIEGGKLKYEGGTIRVPSAPGLGVRLDREKLAEYSKMFRGLSLRPRPAAPLLDSNHSERSLGRSAG